MKILKKDLADEVTWQYEGKELKRDENSITVEAFFNRNDMPFQEIILKRNDRFVDTFYTDKWYNIFEIYDRDDGKLKGWYCNITKPAIIEDISVSYVDLALDLWVSADGEHVEPTPAQFASAGPAGRAGGAVRLVGGAVAGRRGASTAAGEADLCAASGGR